VDDWTTSIRKVASKTIANPWTLTGDVTVAPGFGPRKITG
jgi:hypothetical protein